MIVDLVGGAGYRQPDMLADRSGERVVQEDQECLSSLCDLALRDIQCRAVSEGEIKVGEREVCFAEQLDYILVLASLESLECPSYQQIISAVCIRNESD